MQASRSIENDTCSISSSSSIYARPLGAASDPIDARSSAAHADRNGRSGIVIARYSKPVVPDTITHPPATTARE